MEIGTIDKDQSEKLQEIVDLLVAAGYFRARIKTLSPFDKIVGGMTWAIQVSCQDIDIDLFFQDSLSIGQKITLTESVVKALISMNCPFQIEPHQIQGLDCANILPVIQWLIRTSIEVRKLAASVNNLIASRSYHRFANDSSISAGTIDQAAVSRKYRYKGKFGSLPLEGKCRVVMFEYGDSHQRRVEHQTESDLNLTKSAMVPNEEPIENMEYYQPLDPSQINQLELSKAILSSSLGNDALTHDRSIDKRLYRLEQCESDLKRAYACLENDKHELESELSEKNADEKIEQLSGAVKNAQEKITEYRNQLQSLDTQESGKRIELAEKLVLIKKEKDDYKAKCRELKNNYENRLVKLRQEQLGLIESNQSKELLETLSQQVDQERARLDELALESMLTNQEVLKLRRQVDDIPSRSEMNQYQRRFIELYQLITTKNNEIKKLYTLYNELEDTRGLLTKEISLLESILENLSNMSQSVQNKAQFVEQFSNIVEGIAKVKTDVTTRLKVERDKCDLLNNEHAQVIDRQRQYYKSLKEFREECILNETLNKHQSEVIVD